MRIDLFFFRLYARGPGGDTRFVGSAFPVSPNGGLLTCRHVADTGDAELLVHDNLTRQMCPIVERIFPRDAKIDLAFLRAQFPGERGAFFPLLSPPKLLVGESVYSYGFFAIGGHRSEIEQGYFSGRIVNFTQSAASRPVWSLTLPYPVIEGMSGSAVLTYHNGTKLVGLAYGNRSTRILASETVEYVDEQRQVTEAIHRIVEFGLAYHAAELQAFLTEAGVVDIVISSDRVPIDGLE